MINDLSCNECPWADGASYHAISVDGCPTSRLAETDVVRVVACDGGGDFDASEIAIVEIKGGMFVGWESWTDVTGSGFHSDAYGGDVEVWFARDLATLRKQFSEKALEYLDANGQRS